MCDLKITVIIRIYPLTVLLFASNSFQVWKNGKPSQLKCGDTKVCDVYLEWKWCSSVSAEKGENEAVEKSQEDLRDQNGRWSIVNKYVHSVICASDGNGKIQFTWCTECFFAAVGSTHTKGGQ